LILTKNLTWPQLLTIPQLRAINMALMAHIAFLAKLKMDLDIPEVKEELLNHLR